MPAGEADDPALFVLAVETRRAEPAATRTRDVVMETERRVVVGRVGAGAVADDPERAVGTGSEERPAL